MAELKDTPATHKLKVPSEDEQALGMQLCHATGISGGVVVEKVVNGSPASKGGVMPGFILESIGSEKVTNLNSVTMWREYAKVRYTQRCIHGSTDALACALPSGA